MATCRDERMHDEAEDHSGRSICEPAKGRHIAPLGDIASKTDGAGRQYEDGRKYSERQ